MNIPPPSSTPPSRRRELAALLRIGGPLVGSQVAITGLSFIDTVMAGKLSPLALASVAIGASLWWPLGNFSLGTLLALSPSVAQLHGAERPKQIAPLVRQGLWLSLGLSVFTIVLLLNLRPVLTLLSVQEQIVPISNSYLAYLALGVPAWLAALVLRYFCEGLGDTRPIFYLALAALPLNVLANYVLMYGRFGMPALGAPGCGLATALVWWAQLGGFVLYVLWRSKLRDHRLLSRFERPDPAAIRELLRIGVPMGMMFFAEIGVFALVALAIGSLGTETVAAHQTAINFVAMTFMVPLGLSMGLTVRVGHAAGRGDLSAVRRSVGMGIALAMAAQALNAAAMLTVPAGIARIYTDDPGVIAAAVQLLMLAAVFQLSDGLQVSCAAALRGLKDTRTPMLITLFVYWLVGLPLGWYLGFRAGWGAPGMWIGLIAGLTAAGILLALRLARVLRRAEVAGLTA